MRQIEWILILPALVGSVVFACSEDETRQVPRDPGVDSGGGSAGRGGTSGAAGTAGTAGASGTAGDASIDAAGGTGGTGGVDAGPDGSDASLDGSDVGDAGPEAEAGEAGVAPAFTNLPSTALCTPGGGLSFATQATGTGPIAFSLGGGSTCGAAVTVGADGRVAGTCPSTVGTCAVQVQAGSAHGMATGTLIVEVAPTGLDVGWGTNGCIRYDGGGADLGWSLDYDAAGRMIVSGYTTPGGTGEAILAVWRYNPDGRLDTSFGTGGLATYAGQAGGTGQELGMDVIVDADGYYVSGFALRGAGSSPDNRDAAIWKFTTAGQLDTSFNSTGYFTARPYANRNELHEIALLQVGGQKRIVAAGLGRPNPNWNLIVYLLDGLGRPDPAFDGDGWVGWRAGALTGGRGMAVQNVAGEDRIVVTGEIAAARASMYVQRYTAAGQRDATFGATCTGGAVNEANTTCYTHAAQAVGAEEVVIDRQGRIVVVGYAEVGGDVWDSLVWRLTADGQPDTSFGAQPGEWWRRWDGGQSEDARGVMVDDRGRIVVTGHRGPTLSGATGDAFVARYLDSGELDSSFGTGGVLTLSNVAGMGEDRGWRPKLGPLGRYHVVGWSDNAAGNFDMFVCRVNP